MLIRIGITLLLLTLSTECRSEDSVAARVESVVSRLAGGDTLAALVIEIDGQWVKVSFTLK